MKELLTFCLLLVSYSSYSQGDSIRTAELIANARSWMNKDAEIGKLYLDTLFTGYVKNKPDSYTSAEYEKFMGIYYYRVSKFDTSILHYKKAARTYKTLNSELDQAKIKVNTAMVFNRIGSYDSAILYTREAYKMFDRLGDKKGVGISLNIIGQVYYFNKDYKKAKEYFQLYLKNALSVPDSTEIAGGYNNIAGVSNNLQQYDSAILYYKKALGISKAANNQYSIANSYQNIGSSYKSLGQHSISFNYYDSALFYYAKINNPSGTMETRLNMGQGFYHLKNYVKAIDNLREALRLAEELKEVNMEAEVLKSLSLAYAESGNYKDSYKALKRNQILSDSLFNIEKSKAVEEINSKYETEIKDQQITFLDQENKLQKATNQRNNIIILALVIGVLLLLIVFYLWRQRARIQQQEVLNEQKIRLRESQIQAVINSEEKERKRFASDLHDSMGQLVSALTMNIQGLKEASSDAQVRNEIVDNSTSLLNDIQREIRNIAFNLMPQVLTNEGLIPALQELTARIDKSNQVKAQVKAFGLNERFNEVFEISLYRILQEWISNVLKYAKASEILIQFTAHEDEVIITIEDNGIGFDLHTFEHSKGNGWRSINTRLNLIAGTMDIDTQQGRKNTTLTISVNKDLAFTTSQVELNTQL
ncbi:MAG TPA: sensor histidine kinase [Fulvivirga sp.]|nr:sensor histidine kinase [Fulvivirga sp.]